MEPNSNGVHRHGLWLARSMSRTDLTPLSPDDVSLVDRYATIGKYEAGQLIASAGSDVTVISVVRVGELRLYFRDADRGRQTVGLIRTGGVAGDIPYFCRQPMPFDLVAADDTELLEFAIDDFLPMLHASTGLCVRWTTSVASRLEQTQRRMMAILTRSLAAQVATVLLEYRVAKDGWLVFLAQETIADLLGARRQSVSRVLAEFREQGLVGSSYRRIELLDLEQLAAVAGEPLEKIPCADDARRLPR